MWLEDVVKPFVKVISKEVFWVDDPKRAPPSQRNAVVGSKDVQPGHATSIRQNLSNPYEGGAANAADRLLQHVGARSAERGGVGGKVTASRILAGGYHPYTTGGIRFGNNFKTPAPRTRLAFGEADDADRGGTDAGRDADPLQSSFLGAIGYTRGPTHFPAHTAWRGADGVGARHPDLAPGSRYPATAPAARRRSLLAPRADSIRGGVFLSSKEEAAADMTFEESARKTRAMAHGYEAKETENGDGEDAGPSRSPSFYTQGPRPFDPSASATPGAPSLETLELSRDKHLLETARLTSALVDRQAASTAQMKSLSEKANFKPGYAVAAGRAAKEWRKGKDEVPNMSGFGWALRSSELPKSVSDILFDDPQLQAYKARVAASKNVNNNEANAVVPVSEPDTPPRQALSPLQTRGVAVEAAASRAARASDPVFTAKEDEVQRMIEEMSVKAEALEKRRPSALMAEEEKVDETAANEAALTKPLTEEQEDAVTAALGHGSSHEQMASGFFAWQGELSVTGKDIATMAPGVWLNDEIVNFTIGTMALRETRRVKSSDNGASTSQPRFHLMSTFFVKKLCDGGSYDYNAVRRWTTPKKLGYDALGCDTIIIPVHQGIHWVLATIELKEKRVRLYDSLHGEDDHLLDCLKRWVGDEYDNKKKETLDTSGWRAEHPKDIPRQMNGCDCGVFMLKYADYIASGCPLSFTQADMGYFRRRIVADALEANDADSRRE